MPNTTFTTLRAVFDAERARLANDPHLSDAGKRLALTQSLTTWLPDAVRELNGKIAQRAARVAARDAAKAEALRALPQPSEALAMQVAATARQDADFRAYLTTVAAAGASASPDDRTLVLALASAPHAALFGLGEADRRAAQAARAAMAEDAPEVAALTEEVEALTGTITAMHRTLRGMEPELDRAALLKAGVLARGPEQMSPTEREAWIEKDPGGFALSLADGPDAFRWTDPRDSAPLLN